MIMKIILETQSPFDLDTFGHQYEGMFSKKAPSFSKIAHCNVNHLKPVP